VAEAVLLDTNVLYWILHSPERLSSKARRLVQEGPAIASVASYWEVVIKSGKGTIPVLDPVVWWDRAVALSGVGVLSIRANHVSALHGLPGHHRDPFDRILVAQAIAEGLPLVTSDPLLKRYPVKVIW
jgi:PIN domain nuclease of toxin-antitoxin system